VRLDRDTRAVDIWGHARVFVTRMLSGRIFEVHDTLSRIQQLTIIHYITLEVDQNERFCGGRGYC